MLGVIASAIGILMITDNRPPPVNIDENATFSGYIGIEGDQRYHSIRVYENVSSIHLVLTCPGSDFDLYCSQGELPSVSYFDYSAYDIGGEDFSIENPEEGIWHLMVRSYSGTGQYTLTIDFEYA